MPLIMVVDDMALAREAVARLLRYEGFQTVSAGNGKEAYATLYAQKPDLILLDLMMPEMDGFEFLDEVRQHEEWRDIPIIVITARDVTAEDRARLNGRVESVIQKAGRDDMLRQVSSELAKCVGRQARERTAVVA